MSSQLLYKKWVKIGKETVRKGSIRKFKKDMFAIVKDFDELPLLDIKKPRVGLVGEILVKFSPDANNHIVELVEKEGGEANMPSLLDFFLYCAYNGEYKALYLKGKRSGYHTGKLIVSVLERSRRPLRKALEESKRFDPNGLLGTGCKMGEGWLLTAEMIELIEGGVRNIVCMQPFACLPNHITGRGALKELNRQYPEGNIIAIDYDPGASESNQLNRIKLMMAVAKKNL